MRNYTRGPLVVESVFVYKPRAKGPGRDCVGNFLDTDMPTEIAEANAHLFAKANELLATLIEIERAIQAQDASDKAKLDKIFGLAFNAISRVIGVNR